jgi:hypothetical protein
MGPSVDEARKRIGSWLTGLAVLGIVWGCGTAPTEAPSALPGSPSPSPAGSTEPAPSSGPVAPAAHRIGVRVVDGAGELFDTATGSRFVARGNNLIRLNGYHVTLDPGFYDSARIEQTLTDMERDGYNVVRLFHDHRIGGLVEGSTGLSPAYLDSAVDLLRRAKAHGVQVMFTQDWLPDGDAYAFNSDPGIDGINSAYLSTGGVDANARFFADFARGLIDRGAALDALLAYELRNELHFTATDLPFSRHTGTVTTANGRTYDLAIASARRRMLEDGLLHWTERTRNAVLAVDPTALVAVGFFQPMGPNTSRMGDDRIIETAAAITRSSADFIDLHGYPGGDLDLPSLVENFGLPRVTAKPILLGEFGASHQAYPTAEDAVRALLDWQVTSCRFGFDGWLLWTWDTTEQPEFWNARDAAGLLERSFAPATRPNPCALGDIGLPVELVNGAMARASRAIAGSPASKAIDGLTETIWNAGAFPDQWLEVRLRRAATVEQLRLLVSQYPKGRTTHVVSIRGASGAWRPLATLQGGTADGQWLTISPTHPLTGVRAIRIETRTGPSWVAWREISILGTFDQSG